MDCFAFLFFLLFQFIFSLFAFFQWYWLTNFEKILFCIAFIEFRHLVLFKQPQIQPFMPSQNRTWNLIFKFCALFFIVIGLVVQNLSYFYENFLSFLSHFLKWRRPRSVIFMKDGKLLYFVFVLLRNFPFILFDLLPNEKA